MAKTIALDSYEMHEPPMNANVMPICLASGRIDPMRLRILKLVTLSLNKTIQSNQNLRYLLIVCDFRDKGQDTRFKRTARKSTDKSCE